MNADYQDFKLNKEDIVCVYLRKPACQIIR